MPIRCIQPKSKFSSVRGVRPLLARTSTLSPMSISRPMMMRSPLPAAWWRAVLPSSTSTARAEAPRSSSRPARSSLWAYKMAQRRGVLPRQTASMFAPRSRRSSTASRCLFSMAVCKGVLPAALIASTGTPPSSSWRIVATWPPLQASCSCSTASSAIPVALEIQKLTYTATLYVCASASQPSFAYVRGTSSLAKRFKRNDRRGLVNPRGTRPQSVSLVQRIFGPPGFQSRHVSRSPVFIAVDVVRAAGGAELLIHERGASLGGGAESRRLPHFTLHYQFAAMSSVSFGQGRISKARGVGACAQQSAAISPGQGALGVLPAQWQLIS